MRRSKCRFVAGAVLALALLPAQAASAETLGDVSGWEADRGTYTISAGPAKVRVVFYERDMFRIWMAPDGNLTDPAGDAIVVRRDLEPLRTHWSDRGDHYRISSGELTLRAYKRPLRFALYRDGSHTPVWQEAQGLSWDAQGTTQALRRGAAEQFFGGGMQNGRFSHRDRAIEIARSFNWEDGGNPNPSPFYMSSAGYGAYRNTFAPGRYEFGDPVATRHSEQRFDSFYFYGPSLKRILDGYTELTGRPFLPPIYGLELGDADCYNDPPQTTPDAIEVADGYVEHDMPRGWMLVNDGYGCGYQQLEHVGAELLERDITLGLWTEDGVPNQEYEVGTAGVRVRKLDVAWVGPGYQFALGACEEAYDGIERYSDARGYVWMVEGWAGAQRCAVQWTGDQTGSWENIRFHIPTIHGSGLSGIAWTAGDVDGIFGGSPETYVRDLQWKAFNPVLMTMSGWAPTAKQPWRHGEPYTSINRRYLRLRERLLPYLYTYAAEAHRTGVPPVRSLVLEYPDDPRTWDDTTKYEFLAGESFLVAPVYEDAGVRDGIYLPEGRWVDYWSGRVYEGPRTVNDYAAPLDRLPLFVKAGAVVPMWPEGINNHREVAPGAPLTIDVYPSGRSAFTLYEDDGVTRAHRQGAYAQQRIESDAPKRGRGDVRVTVGPSRGHYAGKPARRAYELTVHTGTRPAHVSLDRRKLPEGGSEGWWYDEGVVHVRTAPQSTADSFTVALRGTSAVGGAPQGPPAPDADVELELPERFEQGFANDVVALFTNNNAETVRDVELSLELPEGWSAEPATPATARRIEPGGTLTTTFAVTPPADAPQATWEIAGTGEYTLRGRRESASELATARTLPTPPSAETYVSDMQWLVAENGWGPAERDTANGESAPGDGTPITLEGVVYERGVGAHAVSRIQLYVGGRCTRFTADVGVDDSRGPNGSITFEVLADGEKRFDSGLMRGPTPTRSVDVSVAGARFVELVITDGGNGKNADHGNWAEAKLACGAPASGEGGSAAAAAPAAKTGGAPNGAPPVVPALREWAGGVGTLRLQPNAPIVVDRTAAELRDDAETLAGDLEELSGRRPRVEVSGSSRRGAIVLSLADASPRLGQEGYSLAIGDRVTVRANARAGAFNGTRTLLQMLKLDRSLPRGNAADWPQYRERGLMLDAGRKYWQMDYLEDLIRQMSWHKLNVLHWHLTEWNAFRLESDRFPGLAAEQAYSKDDVRRLQRLARRYHVTILPEIDLPGHATAILEYDPSLRFECAAMRGGWTIDVTKRRTRDFVKALLDEFVPLFDGPRFHLGTDEYETQAVQERCPELVQYAAEHGLGSTADVFVDFIDEMNGVVRSHGRQMEIWNWWDVGQQPTIAPSKDIVVSSWTGAPEPYLDQGYDVVATPSNLLYLTPTAPPGAALWPHAQALYESWAPPRHDRLRGWKISVWADGAETAPDGYFEWSLRRPREVLADRLWGGPRVGDFLAFQERVDALGAAPGVPELVPRDQLRLTGTPYGAGGAVEPGRGFEAAFDGDVSTFVDAADADGGYAGIDLGADRSARVTALRFYPRDNSQQNLQRMVGGRFQGCSRGPADGCVDLFTVRWRPSHVWHEVPVDVPLRFRWLRYVGPPFGHANVAEVEFRSDRPPQRGGPPNPAWLTVDLRAPDTAHPGTELPVELDVANVGDRSARGGTVTVRLDGAGSTTAELGSIAPGGSETVVARLAVPAGVALGDRELTAQVRLRDERFEAARTIRVSRWAVRYVDSEETVGEDGRALNAFDGDPATYWHSEWFERTAPLPHEIQIDLLAAHELTGFRYLPRGPNVNGMIKDYELYVSADGEDWGAPVARGAFPLSFAEQRVTFPTVRGRYVRLVALSEQQGQQWTNAAELDIEGTRVGAG